jgi:hypothetical protein
VDGVAVDLQVVVLGVALDVVEGGEAGGVAVAGAHPAQLLLDERDVRLEDPLREVREVAVDVRRTRPPCSR